MTNSDRRCLWRLIVPLYVRLTSLSTSLSPHFEHNTIRTNNNSYFIYPLMERLHRSGPTYPGYEQTRDPIVYDLWPYHLRAGTVLREKSFHNYLGSIELSHSVETAAIDFFWQNDNHVWTFSPRPFVHGIYQYIGAWTPVHWSDLVQKRGGLFSVTATHPRNFTLPEQGELHSLI